MTRHRESFIQEKLSIIKPTQGLAASWLEAYLFLYSICWDYLFNASFGRQDLPFLSLTLLHGHWVDMGGWQKLLENVRHDRPSWAMVPRPVGGSQLEESLKAWRQKTQGLLQTQTLPGQFLKKLTFQPNKKSNVYLWLGWSDMGGKAGCFVSLPDYNRTDMEIKLWQTKSTSLKKQVIL